MTQEESNRTPPPEGEPTPPPGIDLREQVRQLEQMAAGLMENKQYDEAEKLFREIVRVAPRHVAGWQYLGTRALERGELDSAQQCFEQFIRIAPRSAIGHQNLGIVLRARGHPEGALQALDVGLKLNPELTMAWVQRGDVLQALGRREEALAAYLRAEALAGNLLLLANQATGAQRTHRALTRAASLLARARWSAVEKALAPLRERHSVSAAPSERCAAAIRQMCGDVPAEFEDPLQKPAYAYVPDMKAKPFFERSELPFLASLEAETKNIQKELRSVLDRQNDLEPYVQEPEGVSSPMTPLNHSPKWNAYHLYKEGQRVPEHCQHCPVTTAAIEALPLVRMEGHAPEAFFSILAPGTHIPPHHGIANYKLAVHLPLIVPPRCNIRAGDETRGWKPGKSLIFDDSFEHEAWNNSNKYRVVLIFEVWHPDLDETERETLSTAKSALSRFQRKFGRLAENALTPGRL